MNVYNVADEEKESFVPEFERVNVDKSANTLIKETKKKHVNQFKTTRFKFNSYLQVYNICSDTW